MCSSMKNDKFPILLSESDGNCGNELVYVKSRGKKELLTFNTSLEPREKYSISFADCLKDVFLPAGYPESVSADYVEYQIWDTVQACASTVTGTLTTKVILQSVGVGNSEASAVSATVTWILKDGTGMVSRILFAWLVGTGLDYDCKKWRLFADIVNDVAMCIELTVLPFYSNMALEILCVSTSLKALVGVAGGATRAAITQHQAVRHNMADVSAKDGSQETCVNLLTSLLGLAVITVVTNIKGMWAIFIAMTFLHIYANYKAVKCLNFTYFNESRLMIAFRDYMTLDQVPCPTDANKEESVFLLSGINGKSFTGHSLLVGHSLQPLMSNNDLTPFQLQYLTNLYKDRKYIILTNRRRTRTYVGLAKTHSPVDVIEAYFHASFISIGLSSLTKPTTSTAQFKSEPATKSILCELENLVKSKVHNNIDSELDLSSIAAIDQLASVHFPKFMSRVLKSGWDVDKSVLPVRKWRAEWSEDHSEMHSPKTKHS